jgi:hypothetical protein
MLRVARHFNAKCIFRSQAFQRYEVVDILAIRPLVNINNCPCSANVEKVILGCARLAPVR